MKIPDIIMVTIILIPGIACGQSEKCNFQEKAWPLLPREINEYLSDGGRMVKICNTAESANTNIFRISKIWKGTDGICHFRRDRIAYRRSGKMSDEIEKNLVDSDGSEEFVLYSSLDTPCQKQDSGKYFPNSPNITDGMLLEINRAWNAVLASDSEFQTLTRPFLSAAAVEQLNHERKIGFKFRYVDKIVLPSAWWRRWLHATEEYYILGISDSLDHTYMVKFRLVNNRLQAIEFQQSIS